MRSKTTKKARANHTRTICTRFTEAEGDALDAIVTARVNAYNPTASLGALVRELCLRGLDALKADGALFKRTIEKDSEPKGKVTP